MSESKHTPGPWECPTAWSGFGMITDAQGKLIFGLASGSPDERRPHVECDANARLIAAAPDLLDALRQWAAAERENDAEELDCARASRDLAIAKAEGRS